VRVGLDYGEEVHRLRILREWGNMIGYEMGFSLAEVYGQGFFGGELQAWMKQMT
jgi:hypothetical protein